MAETKTPVAVTFETRLTKAADGFLPIIEAQLRGNMVTFDQYARQCVLNAIAAINTVLEGNGITWGHKELNNSNLVTVLLNIAALRLNAAANPREVYFQIRNTSVTRYDAEAKKNVQEWHKVVEMGIEGDGNDALLSRFGRGVKTVHPYWVVRECDNFTYPKYNGLNIIPPQWEPTGEGRVVRIVYPITCADDTTQFYIAERADVLPNLLAHISNNLMNETFGVCEVRKDANREQKRTIAAKKAEILRKAESLGLDAALGEPDLVDYISSAWREPHSREQMLMRKMRNNIIKKIPKDFGSTYVSDQFDQLDESYRAMRQEITQNANREAIDFNDMQEALEIVDETPDGESASTANEDTRIDAETGEVMDEPDEAPQTETGSKEQPALPF